MLPTDLYDNELKIRLHYFQPYRLFEALNDSLDFNQLPEILKKYLKDKYLIDFKPRKYKILFN